MEDAGGVGETELRAARRRVAGFAAAVWFTGFVACGGKAAVLLVGSGAPVPAAAAAAAAGVLLGVVKGRTLFVALARKNAARIASVSGRAPTVLRDAYRPWFYVFLATMVSTFAVLSRMLAPYRAAILAVAATDLAVAVALLVSVAPLVALARTGEVADDQEVLLNLGDEE